MSVMRYIKSIYNCNKFVIFGDSKSALHTLLSKWDHSTVQTIMIFYRLPSYCTYDCYFCWLPSHLGNKRADSAAKAALQKDGSECLISYTDAY